MTIYLEAAEAVEREAARAASLATVAADLKRIGSLQLVAQETQQRVDGLVAEQARVTQDLIETQQGAARELDRARRELEDATHHRDDANAKAAEMLSNAIAEVEKITAEARTVAKQIIADGEAAAAKLTAETEARLSDVRNQIAEGQAHYSQLGADTIAAQSHLDDINAKIAELRARF